MTRVHVNVDRQRDRVSECVPVRPYAVVPDTKVHGANMGPIWDRQDPGGPHVGPRNFAIWGCLGKAALAALALCGFYPV